MRDRELLEMAAKAAGIDAVMTQPFIGLQIRDGNLWNPLSDDGDALRLAVKLSISIDVNGMFVHADCRNCTIDIGYFEENSARNAGNMIAATRRAIVRAAAFIGESMQ